MAQKKKSSPIRQLLNPWKVLIPIAIGLAVVAYFVMQELDQDPFQGVVWSWSATAWMVVALLMVACRDVGYMYRLRVLTDNAITWRRAFDVVMLWEFASAVTPSIVGGSGVAIFIVHREGLSVGRSTAVVMITAFLDELFYVVMVPIVLLMVGMDAAFPANLQQDFLGMGVKGVFLAGYLFIVLLILLIIFGIFVHPKGSRALLIQLFRLPVLRRWKEAAARTGDELIVTSAEMRGKNARFWFKVTAATFLSWTARFWIVNFLILAFTAVPLGVAENFLIYARQLSMWVILLISPTPGGAGFAEIAFPGFLQDFIHTTSLANSLAVLWRFMSYYPYLILGTIILPRWVQRVYLKRKLISFKSR